jgi:hypothetical protein
MSEAQTHYVAEPDVRGGALPVVLGAVGLLISVLGPVVVFFSSRSTGWWSMPCIIALLASGAAALILGVMAIRKSRTGSGVVSGKAAVGRVLGIMSAAVGTFVFAFLGMILLFLLLLSASMRSFS